MSRGTYPRTAETRAKISAALRERRVSDETRVKMSISRMGRLTARLAPTEKAAPNDFRWAAGLYEGEGCCRPHPSVVITQKDSWVLERMRALFGGSVRKSNGREIHAWQINGARARAFLMSIYSLLSPRRQEQIRDALGLQG